MKLVKLLLLVMAIVGYALAAVDRPGMTNYVATSNNFGDEDSYSDSFVGGSSVNHGRSNSFTSSGSTSSKVGESSAKLEQNEAPQLYDFESTSSDKQGNSHYHREEADASGTIRGSYGYNDFKGLYQVVDYIADASRFRASIRTNVPGTDDKENPEDVQMTLDQTPPVGIQDKYTTFDGSGSVRKTSGPSVHTARNQSARNAKIGISPISVKKSHRQVRSSRRFTPSPRVVPGELTPSIRGIFTPRCSSIEIGQEKDEKEEPSTDC